MKRFLCTVILGCVVVTLATGQEGHKNSTPVAKEPADVQQALKDSMRAYSDALTRHDLEALDKIWAEGYTFTNGRGEFLNKKERMENIRPARPSLTPSATRRKRSASSGIRR